MVEEPTSVGFEAVGQGSRISGFTTPVTFGSPRRLGRKAGLPSA